MSQVVECVPNFSEEWSLEIVDALAGVVRSVPGVVLLDETKDPDHHRAVVTFAGRPYAVAEVAHQMARMASQLIDLRNRRWRTSARRGDGCDPVCADSWRQYAGLWQLARMVGQRIGK